MNRKRLMKKLSQHKAVGRLLSHLWQQEGTGYTPVSYVLVLTSGCEYELVVNYNLSELGSEGTSGWMRQIGSFVIQGYTVGVYRWVNRIRFCPVHKQHYDQMYWSMCEDCWDEMK